jgi:hypothetical protein
MEDRIYTSIAYYRFERGAWAGPFELFAEDLGIGARPGDGNRSLCILINRSEGEQAAPAVAAGRAATVPPRSAVVFTIPP